MGRYKVDICGVNTASLPVLKNSEMIQLFQRLQAGEKKCKEELIMGNLKLVLAMTQCFSRRTDRYG